VTFEHPHTVRFHETDRAGIIYFSRVFEYCHFAFEELLSAVFGSVEEVFARGSWGMPLVHAEADYARPCRLGDRLVIELRVEELRGRSIAFAYRVRGADDPDDLRAMACFVHAFVDLASFKARAAPAELAAGLERLGLWPRGDG